MLETSGYTWIVPERAAVEDLHAGLDLLSRIEALRAVDLRILTVSPDKPVFVPTGLTLPGGEPMPAGVLTVQTLPPQGLVVVGEVLP